MPDQKKKPSIEVRIDGEVYVPKNANAVPISLNAYAVYPNTSADWQGAKLSEARTLLQPLHLMPADHFGLYSIWKAIRVRSGEVAVRGADEDDVICHDDSFLAQMEMVPFPDETVDEWISAIKPESEDDETKMIVFTGSELVGDLGSIYVGIMWGDQGLGLIAFRASKTQYRSGEMLFAVQPM
jgi:hypothetical protein